MKDLLTSGKVGNIELNAQKKIREDIQKRWERIGLVEGLEGHVKETVATLPGSNNLIITTEKDAIRLRGKIDSLPVYILPVTVAFHKENDKDFDTLIESSVRENIMFLSKLSIWS